MNALELGFSVEWFLSGTIKKKLERKKLLIYFKVYRYKFKIIVYCGTEGFLFVNTRFEGCALYGMLDFVVLLTCWTSKAVKLINKDRNGVQTMFLLFDSGVFEHY